MLRQSLCRGCQVAGKVGQVFRRENLTWIGGQVGLVRFNLLRIAALASLSLLRMS